MNALSEDNTTHDDLAELLDVDRTQVSFSSHEDAFTASVNNNVIGQWESKAALIADVAAAKEFDERYQAWDSLTIEQQGNVLNGLRAFLDRCPSCDGEIEFESNTVKSCCRSIDVVVASCNSCESRLLEVQTSE